MNESDFLKHLLNHATSRFGLNMGRAPAEEMVANINKYLFFASEGKGEDAHALFDTDKVEAYLRKCENNDVESAGLLVKLSHIQKGLEHASEKYGWEKGKGFVNAALLKYEQWKKMLQRERKVLNEKTASQRCDEVVNTSMKNYCQVLTMSQPRLDAFAALEKGSEISAAEFRNVTSYIAVQPLLRHSARVSAVEGMTVEEFRRARKDEEGDRSGDQNGHSILWITHCAKCSLP